MAITRVYKVYGVEGHRQLTRDTAQECYNELCGQITDGIFENSRTGRIEELK